MTAPTPTGVRIDGRKVRRLRKLAGQTLSSFAPKCGITVQYLSQIETGARLRVSPPVFAAICDALSIERGCRGRLEIEDEVA